MFKIRGPVVIASGDARRRGYTLLELLVVIAIMTFLMGLLLPSLKRSMDLAHSTACKINLRQIGQALQMYRFENNGWLPAGPAQARTLVGDMSSASPSPSEAPKDTSPWFAKLFPIYISDPGAMACPKDPYGYRVKRVGSRIRESIGGEVSSYGFNALIAQAGNGYLANIDRYQPTRPLDTILIGDIGPDQAGGVARVVQADDATLRGPSRDRSMMKWSDSYDPQYPQLQSSWVTRRHSGGIHIVTLAGEVRDVPTAAMLRKPIQNYYSDCAAGGCTFCNHLKMYHFSFARSRLFWWTGAIPKK